MRKILFIVLGLPSMVLGAVGSSVQPIVNTSQVLYGSNVKTITSTSTVTIDTTTAMLTVGDITINGTCIGPGCGSGGGGGTSSLAVNQNGVQISSPTGAINALSPPFKITKVGGTTAQWTLDYSSITAQGNSISLSALSSSMTAVGASTGTLSISTVSLQVQLNGLATTYLTLSSATVTYLQSSSATATYIQKSAISAVQPILYNNGVISATLISATTGLMGTLQPAQFPALTGDITTVAGALATTASAQQANIKTFTSSITVSNTAGLKLTGPVIGTTFTFISGGNYASQITSNTILGAATIYADGLIRGSNLTGSASGSNTGDQTITLTGDSTGSGTGSFAVTAAANQANIKTLSASSETVTGNLEVDGWTLNKGSVSVTATGGAGVTYGLSVGSMTGAGLSTCGDATHAVSWNSSTNLFGCQSIAGTGGGGASSSLAVNLAGVQVTSPTVALNAVGPLTAVSIGGGTTAQLSVNLSTVAPSSGSGNYWNIPSTGSFPATFGVATSTLSMSTMTYTGEIPYVGGNKYLVANSSFTFGENLGGVTNFEILKIEGIEPEIVWGSSNAVEEQYFDAYHTYTNDHLWGASLFSPNAFPSIAQGTWNIYRRDNGNFEFDVTDAKSTNPSGFFTFRYSNAGDEATPRTMMQITHGQVLVDGMYENCTAIGGVTNPSCAIDSSAVWQTSATTKGALPFPQMTNTQRNAISSPKDGLGVWNNSNHTLDLYSNGAWSSLAFSGSSGSGIVSPGTFTWTDQQGIVVSTLTVGSATSTTFGNNGYGVFSASGTSQAINVFVNGRPSGGEQNQVGGVNIYGPNYPNDSGFSPALLVLADSTTNAANGAGLAEIWELNPNSNRYLLSIHGSSTRNSDEPIRFDGPTFGIDEVSSSTDSAHGRGKWKVISEAYQSSEIQLANPRCWDNSSFEHLLGVRPLSQLDGGLYLYNSDSAGCDSAVLTSSDTTAFNFVGINGSAVGLTGPRIPSATWSFSLPNTPNNLAQVLYQSDNGRGSNLNARSWAFTTGGSTGNLLQFNSGSAPTWVDISGTYLTQSSATLTYLQSSSATATYGQLNSTNAWTGQQSWTSAQPSTFTALNANSITLQGNTNTAVLFMNGKALATSSNFTWNGSTMTAPMISGSTITATTLLNVPAPSGASITYGLSVGSITGSGLTTCGDSTHAVGYSATTGRFSCQSVTGSGGGGASASALAIAVGQTSGFTTLISSPTSGVNLDQSQFSGSLQGGSTAFVTIAYSTKAATGNYTATSTDTVVMADATGGAITVTLPTAVGISGKIYHIKMVSASSTANTVTVATTSAQTIDGATTQILTLQYTDLPVISDGSNWSVL